MKKTYIITALLSTLLCTQMSFAIETLAPKGDIETSKPTFSWQSVTGASEYKLGYENDMEEGWESYTITASSANCNSVGKVCTFTPPDINVEVGIGMVWWVKEKSNDEWKEWNDATVFTRISQNNEYELIIDDGSGVVNGSHTEQPSQNNEYELIIDDGSGVVNGSHTEQPYYYDGYELIIDDGSGVVNGSHTEQPSWNF